MGLESTTVISGLISSNPTSGDPVSQGDDHITMIKAVLKNTFPGVGGVGFATQITATEAEINQLHGKTNLDWFPSGTKMPFYQASPPTGWTATAIQNDSMMRVVTAAGTGGTSGAGAGHSPILNNVVTSHTHVFTGDPLAAHTHTDSGHTHTVNGDNGGAGGGGGDSGRATTLLRTPITNAGFAVISSNSAGTPSGTNATNAGAANWQPKYMDFCVGTKT
jgi:hypothetical protein